MNFTELIMLHAIDVANDGPTKIAPRYGALEIKDEERRAKAMQALSLLWHAMNLSNPPLGIKLPDNENWETYDQVYQFVGRMLLGEDCPSFEIKI